MTGHVVPKKIYVAVWATLLLSVVVVIVGVVACTVTGSDAAPLET